MADIAQQIASLRDYQIKANTSALGAARDQSMVGLGVEKAKIAPEYYKQRNVASSQSQLGQKNFGEFMANRGQTNSGLAAQSVMSNGAALQGQMGVLGNAETAANQDITRRGTDIGNIYTNGVATGTAAAYSQYNASMIQETQRAVAAAQQQAQFEAQQRAQAAAQAQAANEFAQNIAFQKQQLASANANAAASRAKGGGISAAQQALNAKQNTAASTNDAFAVLNNLANQGKSRTEILNYLNQNSSNFQGADYDALLDRTQKAFTWDKNSSGTWFNTTAKKDPND